MATTAPPINPPTTQNTEPPSTPPRFSLTELLTPVRVPIGIAVILYVISALATIVPLIAVVELARVLLPAASGQAIDQSRVWVIVWVVIGALLVRAVAQFVSLVITHLTDANLQASLRQRIVDHLRRIPLGWFDQHASGRVKKAAQDDVSAMHHLVAHTIVDITAAIVIPVATFVYLILVDWRMALVSLVPLVIAIGMYAVAMGGSMALYQKYDAALAEINAATVEYAGGIAVVKAFGQTGKAHARFTDVCRRFAQFFGDWMKRSAAAGIAMEIASSPPIALLLLTITGAALVTTGTPFINVLPGLVLGLGISAPVMTLGFGFQEMREAQEAAANVGELLAIPPVTQAHHPITPQGSVVDINRVSFSYDDQTDALDNVSITLHPGTVTALVGASGSGKSTLARLIPRFYDPHTGEVTLGGADVTRVATDELYHHVGFVFQDDYLLHTSLAENIALGRPSASLDEIHDVARAAHIHDRILQFTRGYEAVLGEDAELSGGERQRVAIARALLADAPVLILDEATAFADPDSEVAIQQALSKLIRGRTLLVIAHRLHTIRHADQIVVLDQGRIVEQGTHTELLRNHGTYDQLWNATAGADHAHTGGQQ